MEAEADQATVVASWGPDHGGRVGAVAHVERERARPPEMAPVFSAHGERWAAPRDIEAVVAARDDEAVTANSGRIWSPGTEDGRRRRRGPTAGEGIGEAERNSGGGSEWEEPTAALGVRGGDGGRTMAPTGFPSRPNLPPASRGLRHPPEVRKAAVSAWDHCGRHSHLTDSGSAGSSGGGGGGGSGRGQSGDTTATAQQWRRRQHKGDGAAAQERRRGTG
uniref:Uncharacterized protein n=1 Tax=Oryza sativa subsp. japonica TaxID=39947 RepID=Q6ZKV7_ORYSJ|nr:hypothetical protein [Oryza sativa Japonica Group]